MSAKAIELLACLPPGWFLEKAGELVQLKTRADVLREPQVGMGLVVPFGRN
jgi:hypothetical protein